MPEPQKRTVRLLPSTVALIQQTWGSSPNWSRAINDMASKYEAMIEENVPQDITDIDLLYAYIASLICDHSYQTAGACIDSLHLVIALINNQSMQELQLPASIVERSNVILNERNKSIAVERASKWSNSQRIAVIHKSREKWANIKQQEG